MLRIVLAMLALLGSGLTHAQECEALIDKIQKIGDVKEYLQCLERRVPVGVVFAWDAIERKTDGTPTGQTRQMPRGWQVCDGRNRTPNLTGKFLRGVSSLNEAGETGGSAIGTLAGRHSHNGTTDATDGPPHGIPCSGNCGGHRTPKHDHRFTTSEAADHSHGSTLPPYYQVVYICKTSEVLK